MATAGLGLAGGIAARGDRGLCKTTRQNRESDRPSACRVWWASNRPGAARRGQKSRVWESDQHPPAVRRRPHPPPITTTNHQPPSHQPHPTHPVPRSVSRLDSWAAAVPLDFPSRCVCSGGWTTRLSDLVLRLPRFGLPASRPSPLTLATWPTRPLPASPHPNSPGPTPPGLAPVFARPCSGTIAVQDTSASTERGRSSSLRLAPLGPVH
jgi:hypothetical protein